MFISIPTYTTETDKWSYTDFETRDSFVEFVRSKFIKPGDLKLKNTKSFRQQAINHEKNGYYTDAVFRSKDYINYWNEEKEKCRKGVIIDDFYLTKYYYFWLNFLPINDKKVNQLKFPEIWDSQYYFFIYQYLAELEYKYSVVVKKRQWGSTFQHLAIVLNEVWFEQGFINKIAAYDDEYIKADWSMVEEYRTFLNTHTGWYRPFSPDKTFNWQQRWQVMTQGRKGFVGNSSILKGLNLKISPSKGVGGKNNKFYYEEAGITKTMTTTFGYIDPALKLGALTTGQFLAAGSVGELDQCEELKKMAILTPEGYNVKTVKNDFEENPDKADICFFVPEYWSMPPYIDEDGNSMIEEAKDWCLADREKKKKNSSPEDYRLYISQHPFSISEAFAWRKDSIFPQDKLIKQQERIIESNKYGTPVSLSYDSLGKIAFKIDETRVPINKFPLELKDSREGTVVVWEFPEANPKPFMYFAGVDPLQVDKSTTSVSLFAIYIFKNLTEKTFTEDKETKIKLEGYAPVASYVGRYDDLTKVNTIAEMLIVWYNALACVENNVNSFINHMQQKSLQRHLATKDQLSFISDLKTNKSVYNPYGFKMNETIKTYFIDLIYDYITDPIDEIKKGDGTVYKTTYGVERIPDIGLLEELKMYRDDLNVDRFVAFASGLALMKAFRKHNLGVSKVDTTEEDKKKEEIKVLLPERSFFKSGLYDNQKNQEITKQRSYFKNYN